MCYCLVFFIQKHNWWQSNRVLNETWDNLIVVAVHIQSKQICEIWIYTNNSDGINNHIWNYWLLSMDYRTQNVPIELNINCPVKLRIWIECHFIRIGSIQLIKIIWHSNIWPKYCKCNDFQIHFDFCAMKQLFEVCALHWKPGSCAIVHEIQLTDLYTN